MKKEKLARNRAGLLIIDFQEKLFPHVDHPCELLTQALKAVQGLKVLNLPIVVSEQNPKGLGPTVEPIRQILGEDQRYISKTAFSCLGSQEIFEQLQEFAVDQWILLGLEAHICVLQTAHDLIEKGKQVIVLNDAISSRSVYDFSTAIAELRDMGARVTSTETVLFELLKDSKDEDFKKISHLIKAS